MLHALARSASIFLGTLAEYYRPARASAAFKAHNESLWETLEFPKTQRRERRAMEARRTTLVRARVASAGKIKRLSPVTLEHLRVVRFRYNNFRNLSIDSCASAAARV